MRRTLVASLFTLAVVLNACGNAGNGESRRMELLDRLGTMIEDHLHEK